MKFKQSCKSRGKKEGKQANMSSINTGENSNTHKDTKGNRSKKRQKELNFLKP